MQFNKLKENQELGMIGQTMNYNQPTKQQYIRKYHNTKKNSNNNNKLIIKNKIEIKLSTPRQIHANAQAANGSNASGMSSFLLS